MTQFLDIRFDPFPILNTQRLLLRKITTYDANDIFEYAKLDRVTKFLLWNSHSTIVETNQFIERILQTYDGITPPIWGIELLEQEKIIGTIGMHRFRPEHRRIELGFALHPDFWNRGIMTEAVNAVLQYGFETLRLHRIEAGVFEGNVASERVLQKVGMKLEGIFREAFFVKNEIRTLKFYAILEQEYYEKK
ncbi:MAG: GNAT family N-acetyltransferase [bacterium]|nr:GNAT family N-acetyltransferase [bacterium]